MGRFGAAVAGVLLGTVVAAGAAEKRPLPVQSIARVGLSSRVFHPKEPRNWRGSGTKELRCTIWYPAIDTATEVRQVIGPPDAPLFEAGMASPHADAAPTLETLPLVLLSHGSGGSAAQMAWLGTALARAGYIAVAVDHPGNNASEALTAEGFVLWWERATDESDVLDGILADETFGPRIDKTRIAAAGFSIGGYTALALAGAETDISEVSELCRTDKPATTDAASAKAGNRDTAVCHVPEMRGLGKVQDVVGATRKTSGESLARSGGSFKDARVKAVFAIAPAMAFTLTDDSLHEMKVPVEIVVGAEDRLAVPRENADYVRGMIKGARETVLPKVGHYTFLDACTSEGKTKLPAYCTDAPGVDRDAVHAQVSAEAVKFFDRALKLR